MALSPTQLLEQILDLHEGDSFPWQYNYISQNSKKLERLRGRCERTVDDTIKFQFQEDFQFQEEEQLQDLSFAEFQSHVVRLTNEDVFNEREFFLGEDCLFVFSMRNNPDAVKEYGDLRRSVMEYRRVKDTMKTQKFFFAQRFRDEQAFISVSEFLDWEGGEKYTKMEVQKIVSKVNSIFKKRYPDKKPIDSTGGPVLEKEDWEIITEAIGEFHTDMWEGEAKSLQERKRRRRNARKRQASKNASPTKSKEWIQKQSNSFSSNNSPSNIENNSKLINESIAVDSIDDTVSSNSITNNSITSDSITSDSITSESITSESITTESRVASASHDRRSQRVPIQPIETVGTSSKKANRRRYKKQSRRNYENQRDYKSSQEDYETGHRDYKDQQENETNQDQTDTKTQRDNTNIPTRDTPRLGYSPTHTRRQRQQQKPYYGKQSSSRPGFHRRPPDTKHYVVKSRPTADQIKSL